MNEKTLSSKKIFRGKILNLDLLKVKLENDRTSSREIVTHPGAVAIVPFLTKNKIILVRQYRKAVEEELLEIPAGTMDKDESLVECAKRELAEETQYKARYIRKIAKFYPSPGYCNETIHIFRASGLSQTSGQLEEDEIIETEIMEISYIRKLIKKGKIKDSKTLIGLSYFI